MTDSEVNKSLVPQDSDKATHMEEWKQARYVLKSYAERLHDLRKYGFSFLTALLAAGAILTPAIEKSTESSVPNEVKFAVFTVTLLLIAALHLLDRYYRFIQEAADARALILERKLNIELSEVITVRYRTNKISTLVFVVYLLFIIGVVLLGVFVLHPEWGLYTILAIFAFITTGIPFLVLSDTENTLKEDWTISPLESFNDEPVRITLTNMTPDPNNRRYIIFQKRNQKYIFFQKQSHKDIIFKKNTVTWQINDENGKKIYEHKAEATIKVATTFTWIIRPSKFLEGKSIPGVYQLQPRSWPRPLHRRIIVCYE